MKLKFKLNLMAKLMTYFLLVIIVPLAVLGFYSYNTTQTELKQRAEETLELSLHSITEQALLQKGSIESIAEIINDLPALTDYAQQLQSGNVTNDVAEIATKNLYEVRSEIKEITEDILIINSNGTVVLDTIGGQNVGVSLADRDYFPKSMQGQSVWSEVIFSRLSDEPVTVHSIPLYGTNNQVVGVVGVIVKFEIITNIVTDFTIGRTGYAYLMDSNGLILAHPNENNVLSLNLLTIDSPELRAQAQEMVKGNKDSGYYNYEGVQKFNTYGPLGDWFLSVTMDVDDYMATAYSIRNTTFLIVGLFIAIGAAVAFFAARQVTKPILQLKGLMALAEAGDLTVSANVNTRDELEELAGSFNQMILGQKDAMKQVLNTAEQVSSASQQTNGISEEMASSAQNQTAAVEELGSTMNEMSISIGQVAGNITDMASNIENVNHSMEELGKSAEEVAMNTEQTSNTIVEVTAAIQQMTASIDTVAGNAENANKEANRTVVVAQQGKETVDNTIKEMDSINIAMANLTEVIKGLGKAAVQIGDIVEVIDDIAEQTNLLSLNASIEAARAGEHGKGFAVVAGAIGNLAEKSGSATKDITNLIKNIQEVVGTAVETTNSGAKQVQNGVNLVKDTGKALDDIFAAIKQTTRIIEEIAVSTGEQAETSKTIIGSVTTLNDLSMNVSAAMEQQVSSVEEVIRAVEHLNKLAQEVAGAAEEQSASSEEVLATTESVSDMASEVSAGSQEVASTAERLANQATELLNIVSRFKVQ